MQKALAIFSVLALFALMSGTAYANVTSVTLGANSYLTHEKFEFVGSRDGTDPVSISIKPANGGSAELVSSLDRGPGDFSVLSTKIVSEVFKSRGIYNATAFTSGQSVADGVTIQIEFDGDEISLVPEFVLTLKPISTPVTIEEGQTLTFTAELEESVDDVKYELSSLAPSGAEINPGTGKFTFTPDESHANVSYLFDVIVTKGTEEEKQTIQVSVTEKPQTAPEPRAPEPSTPEPVSQELEIPAPFVDQARDPGHYIDRYSNEPSYKEWFDSTYPQYSSIYQAVGLEEPMGLASFVDGSRDPQYYVDRYNSEPSYKEWFDENFAQYSSIYEAVGLEEPAAPAPAEREFGICGPGTDLVGDTCEVVSAGGGGCLIATAAYGSEMASQVQTLREIRDGQLMQTGPGTAFMAGFNQVYYSFSPAVADWERQNPAFKEIVKMAVTPMLHTLFLMENADSDAGVLGYGIGILLMNLGMYVGVPAIVLAGARRYVRRV